MLPKIYLLGGEKAKTRDELLSLLYNNITDESKLVPGSNFKAVATYNDKDGKYQQCAAQKHRSFDDIHALMNTYFPDTDVKTTFETILSFGSQYSENVKKQIHVYLSYCGTMSRIRVIIRINLPNNHNSLSFDSPDLKMGLSEYSWKEILDLSGLTQDTARAYRKKKLQIP